MAQKSLTLAEKVRQQQQLAEFLDGFSTEEEDVEDEDDTLGMNPLSWSQYEETLSRNARTAARTAAASSTVAPDSSGASDAASQASTRLGAPSTGASTRTVPSTGASATVPSTAASLSSTTGRLSSACSSSSSGSEWQAQLPRHGASMPIRRGGPALLLPPLLDGVDEPAEGPPSPPLEARPMGRSMGPRSRQGQRLHVARAADGRLRRLSDGEEPPEASYMY